MSANFWWCLCSISEEEYFSLEPKYKKLEQTTNVPFKYGDVYTLCNTSPKTILPRYVPYSELPPEKKEIDIYKNGYIENKKSDEFSQSLFIPQYSELFRKLPLTKTNVIEFISLEGKVPISVLYYALLPKNSEHLPGRAGNLIVHYTEIDQIIMKVNEVLKYIDSAAWDRARRFINDCSAGTPSKQYNKEIEDIFYALPKSLLESKKRGECFASATSSEF